MQGLTNDTLPLLLSLIPGFLAYRIYTIDKQWSSINQINILFSVLSFGIPIKILSDVISSGWLVHSLVDDVAGLSPFVSIFLAVLTGIAWKKYGHGLFHRLLAASMVTKEDNEGNAWRQIFNNPRTYVSQIVVCLKSGEWMMCEDTNRFNKYSKAHIYPYYADANGGIYFIATHRKTDFSRPWQPLINVDSGDEWGVRVTYLKESDIARIDFRLRPI